ncbi:MAG: hypothetical protein ACRCW1_10430, partial [Anaerotignaceae bacterium]
VTIGDNSTIGPNVILGEHLMDFYQNNRTMGDYSLVLGENALIRSGSTIYGNNVIGDNFHTGNNVCIREKSEIGNNVSVGTFTDIQGFCKIGNNVRMHSYCHIAQETVIEDFVWLFPRVTFTNDPTPPSNKLVGTTVKSFAVISTSATILPGIVIEGDTLIAAGATVVKSVEKFSVIGGTPGKVIGDIRNIKNHETGEKVYPWRYTFERGLPWDGIGYDKWLSEQKDGE